MATTPRFGLNYFGGDVEGDLTDDDDKYTSADRLTIDSVLAALEKHTHHPATLLGEPSSIPDAVYQKGTGALQAGNTYYYVISYVNEDGLETAAGPETSVTLPDLLSTPDAPEAESLDPSEGITGTLTPGVYYYALSSLRDDEESAQGDSISVTLVDGDAGAVHVDLPPLIDGADSYQVWRQKETDPQWTRVGTSSTDSFTDDGSVPASLFGDPANIAPTEATGGDDYSVTVTLTGDDVSEVTGGTVTAWRLYRATQSGLYSAASLVHQVVERTDDLEASPLLSSWEDDGDETLVGGPVTDTTQLDVAPYTFEQADPLPDATTYPTNYPILDGDGVLYIQRNGAWQPISGSGSGGVGPAQAAGAAAAACADGPSSPSTGHRPTPSRRSTRPVTSTSTPATATCTS
jgi:hypothetical protein